MSAQVLSFPSRGLAYRYACLMTLRVRPECRDEAIREYMDFAENLVENGFRSGDLQHMILRERESLLRQLREIDKV